MPFREIIANIFQDGVHKENFNPVLKLDKFC